MNTKFEKYGMIGAAVGLVGLGVSAIVAECRRHKAKKELLETQVELGFEKLGGCIQEAKIRVLEEEIQELKSKKQEGES